MNFIDKIYYINLDKRRDRKELLEEEFDKMQIPKDKIERFPAFYNEEGMIGCNQSHLEVLKLALKNNYENVLIFEDDFKFLVTKENFYDLLNKFFQKYKDDYDVCFLQYNIVEKIDKDEIISQTTKSHGAAGYLINKKIISDFINILEEATKNLIKTKEHWNYQNDTCWHQLQKTRNFYFFNERIGKQRASYSDLSCEFCDRGF